MTSSFADLGVPADLVERLERNGIVEPFDIQRTTIPDALAGRDVLGRAPTGSGKTLAFGIPMLMRLESAKPRRPRGLILSPTRELAEQIRRELAPLAQVRSRHILSVYGGVGFRDQVNGLRNGADLLVACPGRLIDLLEQGELQLTDVDRVVVDEADRMADMGFLPQVREILDLTASDRQTVLFSATLDDDVQVLIDHYQHDPVTHHVGETEPDLTLVTHRFFKTAAQQKLAVAADLIDEAGPTIVFCRTRHGVDRVARQLKQAGIRAGWIHGGRSQSQRDAALHAFTSGKVHALVATDVAARGIHVDGVQCVIHFDPPADQKDYVHRSGRTARAGEQGVVVSFINRDQERAAKKMMRDVGLPDVELEPAPSVSNRADHVKIELRSKRDGKVQPDRRPDRASAPSAPARALDRVDDDAEWRSSTAGPRGRRTGTGPARRVRSAARVERPEDRRSDPDAGEESRRAPSAPRGPKPTTRSGKPTPPQGKTKGKGPTKSKRSGKPRPKNKKSGPKRRR
jgi:superfamily II DNA/RNA helicase